MLANIDSLGHFDAHDKISKYKLGPTTLDRLDVDSFYNTKFSTVFWYLNTWVLMILSWALLGSDMYTCVNILAFHRWSSDDYQPYAYGVAKYIFTGCIIFEFCLLFYHWFWAIKVYRSRNVALLYITNITRVAYSIRSYKFHCLFNEINADDSYDWCCLFAYTELDTALQILVADTPRQVINVLTLRYYATGGGASNDIIANIRILASSNIPLAIILSIMCFSVVIWSIFISKFIVGVILYVYVKPKLHTHGSRSLKKYCCSVVNHSIQTLSRSHFKSRSSSAAATRHFLRAATEDPFASTDALFKLWDAPPDILLDFKYKQAPAVAKPHPLRQAARPDRADSGIQMLDFLESHDPFATTMATPPRHQNAARHNYGGNRFEPVPNPRGIASDYVPERQYDSGGHAPSLTSRHPAQRVYPGQLDYSNLSLLLTDSTTVPDRFHSSASVGSLHGGYSQVQSTDSLAPLTPTSAPRSRRPPPARQSSASDLHYAESPFVDPIDEAANANSIGIPSRSTLAVPGPATPESSTVPYPVRGMSLYKSDR